MCVTSFDIWYAVVSAVASLVIGCIGAKVIGGTSPSEHWKNGKKAKAIHEVWFNFHGALVGFFAIWILIAKSTAVLKGQAPDPTWIDLFLAAIGFTGITGFLPWCAYGLFKAVFNLAQKFLEKV